MKTAAVVVFLALLCVAHAQSECLWVYEAFLSRFFVIASMPQSG